jgi:ribosome-associated translation inhibitor RaiA
MRTPMITDTSQLSRRERQRRERRLSFARAASKTQKRSLGRSTTTETPLHIRARGVAVGAELRDYVRSRTGFKLGKFALRLTRVVVHFEGEAGPGPRGPYTCRFGAFLPGTPEVVASSTARSMRNAFDSAVEVTERAVRRLLERERRARVRSGTLNAVRSER